MRTLRITFDDRLPDTMVRAHLHSAMGWLGVLEARLEGGDQQLRGELGTAGKIRVEDLTVARLGGLEQSLFDFLRTHERVRGSQALLAGLRHWDALTWSTATVETVRGTYSRLRKKLESFGVAKLSRGGYYGVEASNGAGEAPRG